MSGRAHRATVDGPDESEQYPLWRPDGPDVMRHHRGSGNVLSHQLSTAPTRQSIVIANTPPTPLQHPGRRWGFSSNLEGSDRPACVIETVVIYR
jgi:hypothetical protein